MISLPTLFKKTQTGAIQTWQVSTYANIIIARYGQLGGKMQETRETIREGKNIGKANATTPEQQAQAEAQATWTKKLKSGYVTEISDANQGKTDDIIEGGILPMLAPSKSYPTDANLAAKIRFPAYVQPKLDGVRCVAIIKGGVATLWSRTRKPIYSVPHIVAALEAQCSEDIVLDGELYNHDFRNSFEDLMSLIRQSKPMPGHEDVQYHMYDIATTSSPFSTRSVVLQKTLAGCNYPLVFVQTFVADNKAQVLELQEHFENLEYEGAMLRNADGMYESGRRSEHLQKLKSFVDGEFTIIGANEGKARDEGTVGAFVCLTKEGKEFKARLKATWARRKQLFDNPKMWEGKFLTVTYKRFTADGIPYIPIGKAIRDYE